MIENKLRSKGTKYFHKLQLHMVLAESHSNVYAFESAYPWYVYFSVQTQSLNLTDTGISMGISQGV